MAMTYERVSTVKQEIRSFTMAGTKSSPTDTVGEAGAPERFVSPATFMMNADRSRQYIPDSPLDDDGVERYCSRCDDKIQPARVTGGYIGSGRTVYGGYYGVPGMEGIYCPSCAVILARERRQKNVV